MNDYEHLLETELPRPVPDPRFRRELLERILEGSVEPVVATALEPSGRRFVFSIGGAVMGAAAAALAFGAAIGWRHIRGPDEEEAA